MKKSDFTGKNRDLFNGNRTVTCSKCQLAVTFTYFSANMVFINFPLHKNRPVTVNWTIAGWNLYLAAKIERKIYINACIGGPGIYDYVGFGFIWESGRYPAIARFGIEIAGKVFVCKGENEKTFIISDKSEKELIKKTRGTMILFFALSIIFVVLSIIIMIVK